MTCTVSYLAAIRTGRIIVKTAFRLAATLCMTVLSTGAIAAENSCGAPNTMSLQLLGSGGPISDDARASSGSVVWIDGKSRLLMTLAVEPICASVSLEPVSKIYASSAFLTSTPITALIFRPSSKVPTL